MRHGLGSFTGVVEALKLGTYALESVFFQKTASAYSAKHMLLEAIRAKGGEDRD